MTAEAPNARLETFCDGVFAIALTLLVLEIKSPVAEQIRSSDELWVALRHLLPSLAAFLLSFGIILIAWANHHALMKGVNKSTSAFTYANGYLLLTVVLIPFPTALLAEFGFTDAAAPAVVVYSLVNVLGGLAWVLVTHTALHPEPLTRGKAAQERMEIAHKRAVLGVLVYLACTVVAFWFPLTIAITLTLIYINWLIFGVRTKEVMMEE